jgi:hypothetical protein
VVHPVDAVDWAAPWLAPYRVVGEALARQWAQGPWVAGRLAQCLNAALAHQRSVLASPSALAPASTHAPKPTSASGSAAAARGLMASIPIEHQVGRGHALRFVPQADLPEGEAYEAHIFRTGCVPTRDNLHDFFNGLVWLHLPALKRRLNTLQAREIAAQGVGAARGAVRDALTLLDENGALFVGPQRLWSGLRERRWSDVFVTHRAQWGQARMQVVGHALLEKLTQPRKAMCAHLWWAGGDLSDGDLSDVNPSDAHLDGRSLTDDDLPDQVLCSKPQAVLPVLGVPHWWPANEEPGFYDDTTVFRPHKPLVLQGLVSSPT